MWHWSFLLEQRDTESQSFFVQVLKYFPVGAILVVALFWGDVVPCLT